MSSEINGSTPDIIKQLYSQINNMESDKNSSSGVTSDKSTNAVQADKTLANAAKLITALSQNQEVQSLLQEAGSGKESKPEGDLDKLKDPSLTRRLAEKDGSGNLVNNHAVSESLAEILESSQFAALKSSNPEEAKAQAALKMNVLAKLINLPEKIQTVLPGNTVMQGDSKEMLKEIQALEKKYQDNKIPLVDSYMNSVRNNLATKIFGTLVVPLIPVTFMAMADARTPAGKVKAQLSLLQRTLVNSTVETGQLKNIVKQSSEQLDLLNGLDLKTVITEANSKSEAAPKMKLLLHYLMSPKERADMSAGQLSDTVLNSRLDDPNNNRIIAGKEKLNELVAYLSGDTTKIIDDIGNNSSKADGVKTFVQELLGGGEVFLDLDSEGSQGRNIDPFFEKMGISREQVISLSGKIEKAFADLGVIFKKSGDEFIQAMDLKDKEQRLAQTKFVRSGTEIAENLVKSPAVSEALEATSNVTKAVSEKLPNALEALGNELGGSFTKVSRADLN